MMDDQRHGIGRSGAAGRGNRSTSPSSAARSLAGGDWEPRPVVKVREAARGGPAGNAPPGPEARPTRTSRSRRTGVGAGRAAGSTAGAGPRLRAVTEEDSASAAAAGDHAQDRGADERDRPHDAITGLGVEEIVEALHAGIRRLVSRRETGGSGADRTDRDWQSRAVEVIAELRQRLAGDYAVDDFGFDPQARDLFMTLVEPLAESWFRLEVRGQENIPDDGGALLVANHSGTVPIDGLITGYAVAEYAGRDLRPLGADLVFSTPFVGQVARKLGATLACTEDAERLLAGGELAGVWPEGFKGIGKPFSERYKLQRFGRGGFVSSAMRAQVPIVPVSIVGAEEIYPLLGNLPAVARLLGVPYLPITPFFPWLGPLGLVPLPSKWIIEFGEPIRTDAYEPEAAEDPMLLFNVTDQVRETIQQTLYALLLDRGNAFL